jgi:hypothetical protein
MFVFSGAAEADQLAASGLFANSGYFGHVSGSTKMVFVFSKVDLPILFGRYDGTLRLLLEMPGFSYLEIENGTDEWWTPDEIEQFIGVDVLDDEITPLPSTQTTPQK